MRYLGVYDTGEPQSSAAGNTFTIRGRYFVIGKGLKCKHASKLLFITKAVLQNRVKQAVGNVFGFKYFTVLCTSIYSPLTFSHFVV